MDRPGDERRVLVRVDPGNPGKMNYRRLHQ
jgi:hypothetical protein